MTDRRRRHAQGQSTVVEGSFAAASQVVVASLECGTVAGLGEVVALADHKLVVACLASVTCPETMVSVAPLWLFNNLI